MDLGTGDAVGTGSHPQLSCSHVDAACARMGPMHCPTGGAAQEQGSLEDGRLHPFLHALPSRESCSKQRRNGECGKAQRKETHSHHGYVETDREERGHNINMTICLLMMYE